MNHKHTFLPCNPHLYTIKHLVFYMPSFGIVIPQNTCFLGQISFIWIENAWPKLNGLVHHVVIVCVPNRRSEPYVILYVYVKRKTLT